MIDYVASDKCKQLFIYSGDFIRSRPLIKLYQDDIEQAIKFHDKLIIKKKEEHHWKSDGTKSQNRISTGYLGELAVQRFLGIDFINTEVGKSRTFAVNDMSSAGIQCGVKTASWNNVPMVSINNQHYELIVIIDKIDKYETRDAYIVGLATPEYFKIYTNPDLVLTIEARVRKTGISSFEDLIPINCLGDLKQNISKKPEQKKFQLYNEGK